MKAAARRVTVRPQAKAHEAQAQQRARSFVQGDKGLSAGLNRATPAHLFLPSSRAEVLPGALRGALEGAFNADLSALRIHRDSAAAQAAQQAGAYAYAAGHHIVFGAGQFQPHTLDGQALIAHEVTHVLQQTARVGHAGRLQVTTVHGLGQIQCDTIPDFDVLKPAHAPKASSKDRPKFDAVAADLAALVKDPATAAAQVEAYALKVLPGLAKSGWPHQAESLLYDVLKRYKKYELAAQMIERDNFAGGNRINTIGYSKGVVDALEKRNGGWAVYVKTINNVGWLKGYETALLAACEAFVFQAAGENLPQLLKTSAKGGPGDGEKPATLHDHLVEAGNALWEYTTVSNNEWVYRGLYLMHDIDDLRGVKFGEISQEAINTRNVTGLPAVVQNRYRADGLVKFAQALPGLTGQFSNLNKLTDPSTLATELKPYLKTLGGKIEAIALRAQKVWEQAASVESWIKPDKEVNLELIKTRLASASSFGLSSGLDAQMAAFLLELNKTRGLDILAFRELVNPWISKLQMFSQEKLMPGALAAFRADSSEEALAWIALAWWLDRFLSHMRWTAQDTATFPDGTRRAPVSNLDEVKFQQLVMAEWAHWVAKPLNWSQTQSAAQAILKAELEPASVLAIRNFDDGETFKQEPLDIHDMVKRAQDDFGSRSLRHMEPLTLDVLVMFYQATYYRDFAEQLHRLSPVSEKHEQRIVKKNAAIPYLAKEAKDNLPTQLPQRWYTHDARYAPKKNDKADFGDAIFAHPAYAALKSAHQPTGFTTIVPLQPHEVFVWFIPDYSALYGQLKQSQFFQGLVAATFSELKNADQQWKAQDALSPLDWFIRLQTSLHTKLQDPAFKEKEWPAILEKLWALAEHDRSAAISEFQLAFKKAMRRDRQLIANRVKAALERYDADHHDRQAINDVIKTVRHFNAMNGALTSSDQQLQLGTLLLECAPQLESALQYESAFDVVFPILGFMELGLSAAEKIPELGAAERKILLASHENTDVWLNASLGSLRSITATLRKVRDAVQKDRGFKADKTAQTITGFVKYSSPLPLFTPMVPRYGGFLGNPSAQGYRVTEVVRDFIFHPAYGSAPDKKDKTPSGYAPIKFFALDGKTELTLSDTDVLLRVQIIEYAPGKAGAPGQWVSKGKQIDVKPGDEALLNDLYNGVTWAAFGSAMGNIQAGIEAYLEFYLDAAELLPGVGPAIAAARITAAIGQFLASDDYQAILDMMSGSLTEITSGLFDAVTGSMGSDELMSLMLFGDRRLDYLLSHSTLGTASAAPAKPAAEGGGGKFGALKKVIDAFRRLGKGMFKALRKLERYVQKPMQDTRVYASSRPLLSFSLNFASDHIFQIVALAKKIQTVIAELDGKSGDKTALQQIKDDLSAQQKGFGERVHGILKSIEEFKLPHTIIDITPAVASVLTLAEAFIIKKTGFYGKVVNLALKHSGAYDLINSHVAQSIVDAGADPNVYWREKILPQIEERFNTTRSDFVTRMNEVLQSPTFKEVFDPVTAPAAMKVATDPAMQFEETTETYLPPADEANTQPLAAGDRDLIPSPNALPSVGSGAPLQAPIRAHFEGLLNQDLRHVRLHSGSAGDAMTGAFGAQALTSGSHIFMRQGSSPQVLGHELAHVTQQTGSRPLGASHADTPIAARPALGLNIDPAKEAQADEVAAAMTSGTALSAEALSSSPGKTAGLQPTGVNWFTIARMMRDVSNLEKVSASAKRLNELPGTSVLPKDIQSGVDKILEILKAPSKNATLFRCPNPFTPALKMVEARLTNSVYADAIKRAAKEIAAESLEPSDAKPNDPRYLSAGHFGRQLESYVLAQTGLSFSFSFNTQKISVPGKDVDAIDLANPVKQYALGHIHLPYIDGRSPLWGEAVDNTWTTSTPDYKDSMRKALRALLEAEGIRPGIWPLFGSKYQFSLFFKSQAETYLKQLQGAKPNPVPDWKDYVKTDKDTTSPIGVRLAHYDHASQKGTGRESHHLTQYLIADFFSNSNDTKAFEATRDYPGITRVSGVVKSISNADSGGDAIDVDATKGQGRGAKMPTISLAAMTHQKGRLHVTPEADDTTSGTKKSQGSALKNEFIRRLPPALASTKDSEFKAFVNQDRDAAAKAIYRAAQLTYVTVEHHMSTQLENNMAELEYQYYMGLVENTPQDLRDATNPDKETQAQKDFKAALQKVPEVARKHNDDGMKGFGWKLKGF